MAYAFIDLGTNTFHLLVVDAQKSPLHRRSTAVKLGQGGIRIDRIQPDAAERALAVLRDFRDEVISLGIDPAAATVTGTSAIRNAQNQAEFISMVKQATGFEVKVISGDEEARLIYEGVRQAVKIEKPSLIVDIGGGSVEFCLANAAGLLWRQSFEIGGQRLVETFMKSDPISYKSIDRMNDYFREQLLPLANACHQYQPQVLIGSSGSFDTLLDMHWMRTYGELPPAAEAGFDLPIDSFHASYEQFLFKNREERLALPGMIELRVEMIVVASCLIRYLIETYRFEAIKVSRYALKEGLMADTMQPKLS